MVERDELWSGGMSSAFLTAAVAVILLAGCGGTSKSHPSIESGSTASPATRSAPRIPTGRPAACLKVGTDLETLARDLNALLTAAKDNGDTTTAATRLTRDADAAKPDVVRLGTLVSPDQRSIVDQASSVVFSHYARFAQQMAARDYQAAAKTVGSDKAAQLSVTQEITQVCNSTK